MSDSTSAVSSPRPGEKYYDPDTADWPLRYPGDEFARLIRFMSASAASEYLTVGQDLDAPGALKRFLKIGFRALDRRDEHDARHSAN